METTTEIKNLTELKDFTKGLKSLLVKSNHQGATVVVLTGDLGAGKTTLVQNLGRELGILEIMPSPTFGIMKSYTLTGEHFTSLIHMDAYRIEELSELGPLRFAELIKDSGVLLLIEWGERIMPALPKERFLLDLESGASEKRLITLSHII